MIAFGHFAILRPWWLLGLPVLAAFYAFTRPSGGALASWAKACDPHLLAAMLARSGRSAAGRSWGGPILYTLLASLVALAGPAVHRNEANRLRNLDATVFAIDVSSRMTETGHLQDAALAAHDMLSHLAARQVGLLVYAGDAYVAAALTDYPSAIDTDLFALDDSTVPDVGVRPDRVLTAAATMLDEAHILDGSVVLITSGGGLDSSAATRAAARLASEGRRLFVVNAGPKTVWGAVNALAAAGHGFAVTLDDPARLLAALDGDEIRHTGSSPVDALVWRDLGRVLLLFAAVPLLLGFRRVAPA